MGDTSADFLGHRYLTFNSVIRVNQIEVTRDRTEGADEAAAHTPENVQALRDAFERGWPGGRMTWAFSWRALSDPRPNYVAIREMVAGFHAEHGDDVTFIPGGFFANAYGAREQVSRDLHEALARVSEIVGGGFRPSSVVAGFLAAENQRRLAAEERVHVCQGSIWSQYAIDNQDGDGSVCYPYYPSTEHFCKPAQGKADFIDCVNLDGWTCDFLAARREGFRDGFNSRMGVGPIETVGAYGPEVGVKQMLATTAAHFDDGFDLNRFGWVTNCWEASLVPLFGHLNALTHWLSEIRRRWSGARSVTQGEFGLAWRRQFPSNDRIDYRFRQRGSGIGGSDPNMEVRWYMNKAFRLALLRDWQAGGPAHIIDYTRYDLPAHEPKDATRRWSLMGQINQKQTRPQDQPVRLSEIPGRDREAIIHRYPELARE
ncbi:MAG: DUF3863 domain-containing protein [Armatimonadetes bacterium]|nr:DUF3863 domain-containing protein [Armatimonadota bacterium]